MYFILHWFNSHIMAIDYPFCLAPLLVGTPSFPPRLHAQVGDLYKGGAGWAGPSLQISFTPLVNVAACVLRTRPTAGTTMTNYANGSARSTPGSVSPERSRDSRERELKCYSSHSRICLAGLLAIRSLWRQRPQSNNKKMFHINILPTTETRRE